MSCLVQLSFVKKCLEISAEIAEKKDDYHQIFELFGKCIMLGFHEGFTSRVKVAGICTTRHPLAVSSSRMIALISCQNG